MHKFLAALKVLLVVLLSILAAFLPLCPFCSFTLIACFLAATFKLRFLALTCDLLSLSSSYIGLAEGSSVCFILFLPSLLYDEPELSENFLLLGRVGLLLPVVLEVTVSPTVEGFLAMVIFFTSSFLEPFDISSA